MLAPAPVSLPLFDLTGRKVWVAGHRGMVGSALLRRLAVEDCEIVTAPRENLDLLRQVDVERFVESVRPDVVLVAAARVGGIQANNDRPADFLAENLQIQSNIIGAAHRSGVGKLVVLGSSCVYPRLAPQPIAEEALLTGPLEPTNQWYAIAKIAGIKLCQAHRRQYGSDFISTMPTNLYGPNDNFDLASSHVLPALMAKAHRAKLDRARTMTIWRPGSPLREFMHVDDCADAIVFLTKAYSGEMPINIGSGEEVAIRDLAGMVRDVVGLDASFEFDTEKPDGTPRKLLDSRRLRGLGWAPRIPLRSGLASTYDWYVEHAAPRATA